MGNYTVYRHITPDGKSYVGCTSKTIKERWWEKYNHNLLFSEAIKRYGWDGMEHEIIAENLDEDEAYKIEIETIKKYKSNDPQYGFNISKGGKSTYAGLKHTDEYRQKMSKLCKGKLLSEETLRRMKESHKKEKKAVACYTLDGEQVNYFESLHEAAKAFNCHPSNISRACKKVAKTCKGYVWYFV